MKRKSKLPEFKSRDEESEFWKTHSAADFQDELEPVALTVAPKSERSPRCPLDDRIMLSRFIDLYLADGRVKLEKLEELYCQRGHYARLAPEAEQLVRAIEAALKRVQPKPAKIAA